MDSAPSGSLPSDRPCGSAVPEPPLRRSCSARPSLSPGRSVRGAQGERAPRPVPEDGQEETPLPAAPLPPALAARHGPRRRTPAGREAQTQADPAGPALLPVLPPAPLVLQAVTAAAASGEDPAPSLGTHEPQGFPSRRGQRWGTAAAAGQGCPGTLGEGPWEAPLEGSAVPERRGRRSEAATAPRAPAAGGCRWGSDRSQTHHEAERLDRTMLEVSSRRRIPRSCELWWHSRQPSASIKLVLTQE